jgi:hypothetical protein
MAKAEKVLPKEPEYLLTLSGNEAQFIYDVMYMIGGDPKLSRRKYATELLRTLSRVGFTNSGDELVPDVHNSFRSIWFNDSDMEVNSGR